MELLFLKTAFLVILPLFVSGMDPAEMVVKIQQQNDKIVQQSQRITELEGMLKLFEDEFDSAETVDLEIRVSVLEESMADVESDLDDVEYVNLLQDQRINLIETNVLTNEQDIEGLDDATDGIQGDVSVLQSDVTSLDQRVGDLESGGGGGGRGGNVNVSCLEERVEVLEGITVQLTDATSSQGDRISDAEEAITSLDYRVNLLESSGGPDAGDTAFLAAQSYRTEESLCPVVFQRDVINTGGHYSDDTGLYTVPRDGIYQFHVQMQAEYYDKTVKISLQVDGSVNGSHNDQYAHLDYRSLTVLLELQAGQTVGVCREGGAWGDGTYLMSYFHGYMIASSQTQTSMLLNN